MKNLEVIKMHSIASINLKTLFTSDRSSIPNLPDENVIYIIHNDINDKCYVGQAQLFYGRFVENKSRSHLWEFKSYCKLNKSNRYIYNALRKYKCINFTVYIVEELNEVSQLDSKESEWIQLVHSYIYDPVFKGYNMNLGGKSMEHCYTNPTKRLEAIKKSIETRADQWNGDCMGACHTSEARAKRDKTISDRYDGDLMGMCHTPEIRAIASKRAAETNRFNWDGDACGMCHTDEVLAKAMRTKALKYGGNCAGQMVTKEVLYRRRKTQLFESINGYIKQLIDDGASQPITWDTYWDWSDGFLSNPMKHVSNVLEFIQDLRSDDRWTPLLESIFSDAELKFKN